MTHPGNPIEIAAIDWVLRRLVKLIAIYPERTRDLAWRIDSALDERLRLMRVRDQRRRNHFRVTGPLLKTESQVNHSNANAN